MSLSTDVSQDTAGRLPGSPRILSGSRTAASPNTGMFYRMKRPKPNRRAGYRCLAIASPPDPTRPSNSNPGDFYETHRKHQFSSQAGTDIGREDSRNRSFAATVNLSTMKN